MGGPPISETTPRISSCPTAFATWAYSGEVADPSCHLLTLAKSNHTHITGWYLPPLSLGSLEVLRRAEHGDLGSARTGSHRPAT